MTDEELAEIEKWLADVPEIESHKWARNLTPEQLAALDSDDFQIGPPPEPKRKTVTVRIPVAVYPDGAVVTRNWDNFQDEEKSLGLLRLMCEDSGAIITIAESTVTIPEPVEAHGGVR